MPDALTVGVQPTDLNALTDLAIETDNYQREQRWEHSSHLVPTVPLTSSSVFPARSVDEPMQLGRARLTHSALSLEACLYYQQAGHFIADCPSLQKN